MKTKSIRVHANRDEHILLGEHALEDVCKFAYPSSSVSKAEERKGDIEARIARAGHANIMLKAVLEEHEHAAQNKATTVPLQRQDRSTVWTRDPEEQRTKDTSNQELRQRTSQQPIWEPTKLSCHALDWNTGGKRKTGHDVGPLTVLNLRL